MVDSPSPKTRPLSGNQPQAGQCPPDCDLPENSPESLDAKLDHAIEETFPTSDPVSVMVTKKAIPPERRETPSAASSSPRRDIRRAAEGLVGQAKETLRGMNKNAPATVQEAYSRGQQLVHENPWPAALIAGAVSFGLAWLVHGRRDDQAERLPSYARSRYRYAPDRGEQHSS